jgi:AmmeMemoRadiSam system protein A
MTDGDSAYIDIAKRAVESYVKKGEEIDVSDAPEEIRDRRAGAFVCLKIGGELRGCIGTIRPATESLAEEIRNNAISSAMTDPRFIPVRPTELDSLQYSVDILEEPEDIPDISHLDPTKYGVIVRSGIKTGLLLPDLEGVETAEEQVRIASMKAGIRKGEPVQLQRFKVTRHDR